MDARRGEEDGEPDDLPEVWRTNENRSRLTPVCRYCACRFRGVCWNEQASIAGVLGIIFPGIIAPEPAEHLRHDRPALLVGMSADAPGVIHVVFLGRQSLDHLDVLSVPV